MSKHLLSICIPTNGVARWVVPTLQNIYGLGSDESTFEVVVADNGGEESDLAEAVKQFEIHSNFRYIPTSVKGFYNIVENFSLAKGDYMIKLNHRCILHKGMIEYIIEQAEKYFTQKPLIFFSNGNLGLGKNKEYSSFDSFMYDLSYWSSMSEGLFFWKEDVNPIPNIKFAPMSPNVSLFFNSRSKSNFVVVDKLICHDQEATDKYGYDIFDTFAVLYLDLVNQQREDGFISKKTFIKIKHDILSFLGICYLSIRYLGEYKNYSLEGMQESLSIYYSEKEYDRLLIRTKYIEYPKAICRKVLYKLLRRK